MKSEYSHITQAEMKNIMEQAVDIGPLVAAAVAKGYAESRDGAPTPYRGYYYLILTRQGKDGPGGAKRYIGGRADVTGSDLRPVIQVVPR